MLSHLDHLPMWYKTHEKLVLDGAPDLSSRQFAILLHIYLTPPPHTVRGLAENLNLTKPVITRALTTLGKYGLVLRKDDPSDQRNVIISPTVDGALWLEQLDQLIKHNLES